MPTLTPPERLILGAFGWVSVLFGGLLFFIRFSKFDEIITLSAGLPLILAGAYMCHVAVRGEPSGATDDHAPTVLLAFERAYLAPLALLATFGTYRLLISGAIPIVRFGLAIVLALTALLLWLLTAGRVGLPDTYAPGVSEEK